MTGVTRSAGTAREFVGVFDGDQQVLNCAQRDFDTRIRAMIQFGHLSTRSILLIIFTLATAAAMAQSQRAYRGRLDGRLHIDPESLVMSIWNEATPENASKMGLTLKSGDRLFSDKLTLSREPVIAFDAVIVRSTNGDDALYVDLNKDGRFEEDERFIFQPIDGNAPESKYLKNRVGIEVPVTTGPYRTCPMEIGLPSSDLHLPMPIGPRQIAVGASGDYFVEGHVQLPKRSLLMRFEYNFKLAAIDINNGVEWADVNGDGKIDSTRGSPEMQLGSGKAPVFRVGETALSAQSVDLATNVFFMRSVPFADYHRIDIAAGSTLPDFEYTDFDGKSHHLSEIKARYLLLDFWATWCEACVADLPSKSKVYQELHDYGFEILGMDGKEETLDKPRRLLGKMKISWPQARYDRELIRNQLQITQWPTLLLIDAHRRIVSTGNAKQFPLDGDNLRNTLLTLLREHN